MKPGKGPQRRTSWVPTAEQVARWDVTQREARKRYAAKRDRCSSVLTRAPQIRAVEPKPRKKRPSRIGESRARRLVRQRSGGLCEIRLNDRCAWWAVDWSHRIRRSQGGLWEASNGLDACRPCHRAITNTNGHRVEYRRLGLVLDRGDNPLTEPVTCIHGRVHLTASGGYEPADTTTTGEAAA